MAPAFAGKAAHTSLSGHPGQYTADRGIRVQELKPDPIPVPCQTAATCLGSSGDAGSKRFANRHRSQNRFRAAGMIQIRVAQDQSVQPSRAGGQQ